MAKAFTKGPPNQFHTVHRIFNANCEELVRITVTLGTDHRGDRSKVLPVHIREAPVPQALHSER